MARAYNNLGDTYLRTHELENALSYFKKAEKSASIYGNEDMRGWVLFNIAETMARMGNVAEGKKYLEESEEILSRMNDQLGLAQVTHCRGLFYAAEGKNDKAEEAYNKALASFKRLSTPLEQGLTLKELGSLYLSGGQKDRAQKVLLEAKSIFTNHQIRDEAVRVQVLLQEAGIDHED